MAVYPPLLEDSSPLAPFPYPLPGTAGTFARFGAVPASGRNLYRALSRGEHALLFPGGGRECATKPVKLKPTKPTSN